MKECEDCRYARLDDEIGYECSLDDGTMCPYNDEAEVKKNGINIVINAERMEQYIRDTLQNTIETTAKEVAEKEIRSLITEQIKEATIKATEEAVTRIINQEIDGFMDGEITISSGWMEPSRTISRREYMQETISKTLEAKMKDNPIGRKCEEEVSRAFRNFADKLKADINRGIKDSFTEVMRQTLADSVVNMLMANDTYAKLSNSMQKLIP